jgi:hypothetical protein
MQAAIDQFRTNINRVRHLGNIYRALRVQTTDVLDLSDILRTELVMAVSALDHYIHELARLGMLEAYQGNRTQTSAFLRFSVSIDSVLRGILDSLGTNLLEGEITRQHGHQSFQQPDRIADAIRLISDVKLWPEVAEELGMTTRDVKEQLALIIDRRNKIAHEADINPTIGPNSPNNLWPISEDLADNAIDFIEQVAEAIYVVVQ